MDKTKRFEPFAFRILFLSLVVLLLCLLGFFCFLLYSQYQDHLHCHKKQATTFYRLILDKHYKTQTQILQFLSVNVAQNEQLLPAWQEKNYQDLQEIGQTMFIELQKNYNITHFFFIDPELRCLIRFHKPEFTNDLITRRSAITAAQTGRNCSGIELGSLGLPALRSVQPVFYQQQLLGYVEVGKSLDKLLEEHKLPQVELALFINKAFLERENWEKSHDLRNTKTDWQDFPDYVLNYTSHPQLAPALIANKFPLVFTNSTICLEIYQQSWQGHFLPFSDMSNREIAQLLMLHNTTDIKQHLGHPLKRCFIPLFLLLPILVAMIYLLIRRSSRHIAQQQLQIQKQSQQLHTLIEAIPDIISRLDRNGRHLFVSQPLLRITNLNPAQAIGHTHRELNFSEEACEFWEKAIDTVYQTGQTFEGGFSMMVGNELKFLSCRLLPEFDSQGIIQNIVTITQDITKQKQLEQKYTDIFKHMLDAFALHEIICDEQGRPIDYRFLAINSAFEKITGLKAEDINGKTVLEVLPEVEQDWIQTYGKVALTGQSTHFESFSQSLNKHFEVRAFCPQKNQFACIFTDVTEKKALEAQLLHAQKMESIGRLASGVAHDFNNMLLVIDGYAEMSIAEHGTNNPELTKKLQEIKKATSHSTNLTKQLLTFVRQQNISPKVLNINHNIEDILKMLKRLIGENITLLWKPTDDSQPVLVDPVQLNQVLANLCINARESIQNNGKITIETANVYVDEEYCQTNMDAQIGYYTCLTVSDNGCGINQKQLINIFEPFYTTKKDSGGTGLGLSIVYGIVKQNKGFIHVYSELNKGSVFRIYLPACDVKTPELTDNEGDVKTALEGSETILLVEDTPTVLKMVTISLKAMGYLVLGANHPQEALQIAKNMETKIDLLITDVIMPEMNGKELSTQINKLRPNLPMLFISGYTDNVIAHHGILDQKINFLQKPFSQKELHQKIKQILC